MNQLDVKESLMDLERRSWDAWKGGEGDFFQEVMAEDGLMVGPWGIADRAAVMRLVSHPHPELKDYLLGDPEVHVHTHTAVVAYKASFMIQKEGEPKLHECAVAVSSVYVRLGEEWKMAVHQQSTIEDAAAAEFKDGEVIYC